MINKLLLLGCLLFSTASYGHKLITVTTPSPDSYVSANIYVVANTPNQPLYTVPSGKTFVLTDIISTVFGTIDVSGSVRLGMPAAGQGINAIHLKSGIIFNSSEALTVTTNTLSVGTLTISGYLY